MKILATIIFLLPLSAVAQTKQDYNLVMEKFVQYYNAQQNDSICTLFPDNTKVASYSCFWNFAEPERIYKEYGTINSYEYLGTEGDVTIYKVVYDKFTKAMSFNLDENLLFGTFRFDTSSDKIKEMLHKAE